MYRIGQEEKEAVCRVIDSGSLFKTGKGVESETYLLQKKMREWYGVEHALVLTSGVGALTSAMIAMGIGPGDEVIVPAYTYIATVGCVLSVGAIPVVAEVDETMMIDPVDVEKKITSRTKAIVPVHMVGFPCNMEAIMAVAKKHGLYVLEDTAQGNGASYHGKKCGTYGDIAALSFNFYKILSAGEGGGLLTNNKELYEKAFLYHDCYALSGFEGETADFTTEPFLGNEYRCTEITSAILRVQYDRLPVLVADLNSNKKKLLAALEGKLRHIPMNDADGDSAINATFLFDSGEACMAFRERYFEKYGIRWAIPGSSRRHVYHDWGPIVAHRGALHPAMDPFRHPANADILRSYTRETCPFSANYLDRCLNFEINPDWTDEDIQLQADKLISCL